MATLVLSQIGSAIGGPVASIAGAFAGSAIDRSLLGSSRRRGPRLDQLAVQGSGYGGTIPRIYGRMRVAGNIIWSTPVRESRLQTGGKAGTGGSGYSVSLAIALSATPITAVGRVWADGKQIRSESGEFAIPVVMRVYTGSEAQGVDPLIEAAEGTGNAPAYRGLAYLVLEDLQLAEFAGRVPQFSFEVICQNEDLSVFNIVTDLAATVGLALDGPSLRTAGAVGYAAGHQGGIEEDLEAINLIEPFAIDGSAHRLELRFLNMAQEAAVVSAADLVVQLPGGSTERPKFATTREQKAAREFTLIYAEPARDFEPCVQRSITGSSVSAASRERRAVPFALGASLAKQIAERELANDRESRDRSAIALPLRYAVLSVGDEIWIDDNPPTLNILAVNIENGSIDLSCWRKSASRARSPNGYAGRKLPTEVRQQGPTCLLIADIPQLPSENFDQARLLIAPYSQSADWQQATILMSTDGGMAYSAVGVANTSAITGTVDSVLDSGPIGRWDEVNSLIIKLNSGGSYPEPFSRDNVLLGKNIALVGSELLAFCRADPIGSNSYMISGLLRGLYGTDRSISNHLQGDPFVAIDESALIRVLLPSQYRNSVSRFKAVGPSESIANTTHVSHRILANNLIPLNPAHLHARIIDNADIRITWIRRSRIGFFWLDGVDSPLGERTESYEVNIGTDSGNLRAIVSQEEFTVSRDEQLQFFGGLPSTIVVSVAQISELVGNGLQATKTFQIR